MTGYTVHTGSTEKFAEGWDQIFRQKGSKTPAGKPAAAKPRSKKKRKQADKRE